MRFELGKGDLMIVDGNAEQIFDLGEVTSVEMLQDNWSPKEEPEKAIRGWTNSKTCSFEGTANIDQELFDDICTPSNNCGVIIESVTPILVQARWHKKARIRKKWLKRYGYKEDKVKTIMKAKSAELNTDTGEFDIEIESIEYIFKPYQLHREVRQ